MIDIHSIFPREHKKSKSIIKVKLEHTPIEINNMDDDELLLLSQRGTINERDIASEALSRHRKWNNMMENYDMRL